MPRKGRDRPGASACIASLDGIVATLLFVVVILDVLLETGHAVQEYCTTLHFKQIDVCPA